jgi:hypothetical protein
VIARRVVLAAAALISLLLPYIQIYASLANFSPSDEAIRIIRSDFPSLASTPWAIVGMLNSILVLLCVIPKKTTAVALTILSVVYVVLMVEFGRALVMVGPFILLTVAIWLYVAASTFRRTRN